VLLDFPPITDDALKEVVHSFTADRVCADILNVADAAGIRASHFSIATASV
jgi:hypothetical protein